MFELVDQTILFELPGADLIAPLALRAEAAAEEAEDARDAASASALAASLDAATAIGAIGGVTYATMAAGMAAVAAKAFFTVVGDGTNTFAIPYQKVSRRRSRRLDMQARPPTRVLVGPL